MRRWLLRTLAMAAFRGAWIVLPLLAALTVAACWDLEHIRLDTSLASFLPPPSAEAQGVSEILNYRKLEPVLVVVHARDKVVSPAATPRAGSRLPAANSPAAADALRPATPRELEQFADALAPVLNHPRYVQRVVYKTDESAQRYYDSLTDLRFITLLTPDDWRVLKQALGEQIGEDHLRALRAERISAFLPRAMANDNPALDPLGALGPIRQRLATSRGPTRLDVRDGYFISPDGRTLTILVYPIFPPENGRATLRTMDYLAESRDFLFTRNPVYAGKFEVEFLGSYAVSAQSLTRVQQDFALLLHWSVPLGLLLILLVYRKLEAIVFILLPPALGALWTLGLAMWLWGGLSWVAAAVLIVLLGIALLHSVHLYNRFIFELYDYKNYYRALAITYAGTGRGVLASASVAFALFFMIFLVAVRQVHTWQNLLEVMRGASGFGQLGVIAGASIVLQLAACLLTLPTLAWVKYRLSRGRVRPVALFRFLAMQITEPMISHPRAAMGALVLLSVVLGFQTRGLDMNSRLASIRPFLSGASPPTPAGNASIAKPAIEAPGRPVVAVVSGHTLQDALQLNDALYDRLQTSQGELGILAIDSLRPVLPSRKSQEASMQELRSLDLTPYRAAIARASRAAGFKPLIYEPFISALLKLQASAAQVHYIEFTFDESSAFIETVQRYVTLKENGTYFIATSIYPHAAGFTPRQLAQLEMRLGGDSAATLIGDPLVENRLSQRIKYNFALMILVAGSMILLALGLHFRSQRAVWLTLVPVACELLWLLGGMGLAGVQFHFFTLLIMPLVLSLAMDNALQMTQYFRDRSPCTVRHAVTSSGRATLLGCGLLALFYGTFALADFPGMRDFGKTLLFAALAVALGTLTIFPALLQIYGAGAPFTSVLIPGSGMQPPRRMPSRQAEPRPPSSHPPQVAA